MFTKSNSILRGFLVRSKIQRTSLHVGPILFIFGNLPKVPDSPLWVLQLAIPLLNDCLSPRRIFGPSREMYERILAGTCVQLSHVLQPTERSDSKHEVTTVQAKLFHKLCQESITREPLCSCTDKSSPSLARVVHFPHLHIKPCTLDRAWLSCKPNHIWVSPRFR